MNFSTWLDTFVEEKGLDTEFVIKVTGETGLMNHIPLGILLDVIKEAPTREQLGIKAEIVRLDFLNADVMGYFEHLAKAIAI